MHSLEDRVRQSSRRGSAVAVISNPLEEDAAVSAAAGQLKSVKLSETRPISTQELKEMCERLQALGDNQSILDALEREKQPFMFTCADLIRLLNVTTSIKTKLAMITGTAPRVSDPKAGLEQVTSLFRYAEDKDVVEEAFKTRIQAVTGATFARGGGMLAAGRGGGRGRGAGRGGSQRPSLESSEMSASASSTVAASLEEDQDIAVSRKPFSSG